MIEIHMDQKQKRFSEIDKHYKSYDCFVTPFKTWCLKTFKSFPEISTDNYKRLHGGLWIAVNFQRLAQKWLQKLEKLGL